MTCLWVITGDDMIICFQPVVAVRASMLVAYFPFASDATYQCFSGHPVHEKMLAVEGKLCCWFFKAAVQLMWEQREAAMSHLSSMFAVVVWLSIQWWFSLQQCKRWGHYEWSGKIWREMRYWSDKTNVASNGDEGNLLGSCISVWVDTIKSS